MPQIQLPIFPAGSVEINRDLACRTEAEQVVYYNGHLPVFTHAKSDLASFRLFTSPLILQGSATQGQVAKAFGVPLVAIKRATKVYRHRGAAGFFAPKARRQGTKLNAVKLEEARAWLVQGEPLAVVSRRTGVLTDTLRKAIEAGRLPPVKKRDEMVGAPSLTSYWNERKAPETGVVPISSGYTLALGGAAKSGAKPSFCNCWFIFLGI